MRTLVIVSSVILLTACAPPRPPVVDGSNRHSVNTPETAEVIALRTQLAQSQERLRLEQARPVIATTNLRPVPLATSNSPKIFSVHFPYNGTKFQLNAEDYSQLMPLLVNAGRIEVRGRTDGQRPTAADERVALNRALSAQRYLIGQGVSPAIISVNYVSAGDYVADNYSPAGRMKNRRVDIVIFNK